MADINKVMIVGRLTRDAELSYTQSGSALLKFGMAVNRWRSDQNAEEASFFDVTVWGKRAESIASFMTKGKQVAVEGELRQDRWQDKNDGSNRSKVTIVANNIQLLGGRDGGTQGGGQQSGGQQNGGQQQGGGNFGDGNNNAGGGWNGGNAGGPAPSAKPQPQGPPPTSFEDDIPF